MEKQIFIAGHGKSRYSENIGIKLCCSVVIGYLLRFRGEQYDAISCPFADDFCRRRMSQPPSLGITP